jgi:anaerobic ribonucleoside-triphosphate reductase activating protein
VDQLLSDASVTGLTFSGGEPMLQAAALARLARLVKAKRDVDIICFSGFPRAYLETNPPGPGVNDLFDQIDVLIDGPYIERWNDNRGLRGSSNQKIHYLTDRLKNVDLNTQPRRAEINLTDGHAMLVGVPPLHLGEAFNKAVNLAQSSRWELLHYERV